MGFYWPGVISRPVKESHDNSMNTLSRRELLSLAAVSAVSGTASAAGHTVGFNNGTNGTKSMKAADALRTMAKIGYDGVELALMPGWPTDPAVMSEGDRKELRGLVNLTGRALPASLEVLGLKGTAENRAHNLERLKLAIDLGHVLMPGNPPVVETILAGKSEEWEQVKGRFADELAGWARLGEERENTICFKPHAGQAVDTPERAIWLLDQVRSKRLRIVYDYSHFFVEGLPLDETLRKLIPYTAYVAVKDATGTPQDHQFLLPGDGKTDYARYFRLLKELEYSGFVGVEVSAMIHRKPDYQTVPALRLCYERLAPIFKEAGLQRPVHRPA